MPYLQDSLVTVQTLNFDQRPSCFPNLPPAACRQAIAGSLQGNIKNQSKDYFLENSCSHQCDLECESKLSSLKKEDSKLSLSALCLTRSAARKA